MNPISTDDWHNLIDPLPYQSYNVGIHRISLKKDVRRRQMASKAIERVHLESFLKSVGCNYSKIDERESPDFIVYSASRSFGVEVTQIFKDNSRKGSKKKTVESMRDKFLAGLADEYYRQEGCAIALKGKIWTLPDQSNRQKLLQKLHEFVHHKPWECSEILVESVNKKYAKLFVTRLPDSVKRYDRWICMNNSIGWVRSLDKKSLEAIIQKKSENIQTYRNVVNNVVLLIVADRIKESGMLQWDDKEMCSNHGFISVYLHVFPLETKKIAQYCFEGVHA